MSIEIENYKIYCLSYNNPIRKLSMKNRFEKLKKI